MFWAFSSVGRALAWHARGQRFDPAKVHSTRAKALAHGKPCLRGECPERPKGVEGQYKSNYSLTASNLQQSKHLFSSSTIF